MDRTSKPLFWAWRNLGHNFIFFIIRAWFPDASYRHSICYIHQAPLETRFNICNSEKEFSVGNSTAPVINRGNTKGQALDFYKLKDKTLFFASFLRFFASFKPASDFFPTLRCFLLCLLNPPLSKRWHIPTWFHFKDRHSFPSHTVSCLSSDYPCMSTREFIPHLAGNSPHNPALFQVTQSLSVQRHI